MRNMRLHVVFAIALSAAFLSGCAFGTRHPMLAYTAITPVKAPNNISINVVQFNDSRPDKNIIGNVRNGWGMKTADVITDTNIADWITNALKAELKNAGYNVVQENASNSVSGDVLKVYCDTYLNYEGEVMIKIVLKKDNAVILDKTYSGKSTDLCWAATAKSYGIVLERSLQQAMNQVMEDLERSAK